MDNDDIYDKLLKQGFLKREIDIKYNKQVKEEQLKKVKILNKVLYRNYVLDDNEKFTPDIISLKDEKNLTIENLIEPDNYDYVNELKKKFEIELQNYSYIKPTNISNIKPGGYIRCVDTDENLKWGGTVVKLINENNLNKFVIKLMNTTNKFWTIKYNKYYVFYKNNITYKDTFKDIFIKKANLNF
jgi:hypothetical protein